MGKNNKQSLEINYGHLKNNPSLLANLMIKYPGIILPYFNEAVNNLTKEIYPNYSKIKSEIFARVKGLQKYTFIKDLRAENIGPLIQLKGIVTKMSSPYSEFKKVFYICIDCGQKKGPFNYDTTKYNNIGICPCCQNKGPYKIYSEESIYSNYQRITIQEHPSIVIPRRNPKKQRNYFNK